MTGELHPQPVRRALLTPGVSVLLALAGAGCLLAGYRFFVGLAAVTNLDQQHPWGLWIAIDVATGVALAAGGFTSAALVHVFNRHRYHAITRSALLTALLGYTFVGLGLMVDLGRYYNIWHPAWPTMWQGNSVLFEVGMCVMCYLTVLYIEFVPVVCERLGRQLRFPRVARWCGGAQDLVTRSMFLFILAGVVLSCLHQSSLGNLMVIAPSKMHPLWYTPILSWLFLLSAIAVGFPMIIMESLWASWAFQLPAERKVVIGLGRIAPVLLGAYLAFKVGDLAVRESYSHLATASSQSAMFVVELGLGVIVPLTMYLMPAARRSLSWLFVASLLVVLGVALNRVNVFLVAYQPPFTLRPYFPSWSEIAVTLGLISALVLCYRVLVTYLPVIAQPAEAPSP